MTGALQGRRIALLETREADRLAAMLCEEGAEVVACPAVAIAGPADPGAGNRLAGAHRRSLR